MRGNAADTRRMFPERVRRHAVEDHAACGLQEEGQQVPEDLGWNRHHPVLREQSSEDVGVAECVGDGELREHARRKTQVHPDREDVAAPRPATHAEDQALRLEQPAEHLHDRVGDRPAGVDNRTPTHLDDVHVRQHAYDR